MEQANLLRLENMILAAQKDSTEARRIAEDAAHKVVSHEQLCSERYANIATQLKGLVDINKSLMSLTATANKAIGMWLGLTGISIIIGAVYTVYKLTQGG